MFSNNSQLKLGQGIRNSGGGPFYNLNNSGIMLDKQGNAKYQVKGSSEIGSDSRRNSAHFVNPIRNSRHSHTSRHSQASMHSQSSQNVIYRNDNSQ